MPFLPEHNMENPALYSPLELAFVGDAVYELFVRTRLAMEGNVPVAKLHAQAIGFVKAKSQAESVYTMMDKLTEQEAAIYKRGRNAKSQTVPKHAELTDYRAATGLEALFGYLYLKGEQQRLDELMGMAYDAARPQGAGQEEK